MRSSTYYIETFCNCAAFGTYFLSVGDACVFRFCFTFDKIFALIPKFSFFQGCLLTGCLNGGFCVLDKKENLFSCSCKIPWTGKKCENKNGKICFTFFLVEKVGPL